MDEWSMGDGWHWQGLPKQSLKSPGQGPKYIRSNTGSTSAVGHNKATRQADSGRWERGRIHLIGKDNQWSINAQLADMRGDGNESNHLGGP